MRKIVGALAAALAVAIAFAPAQAAVIGADPDGGKPAGETAEFFPSESGETPVPAALPLFIAGIAGFGFAARGKTQKAKANI